MIDPVFLEFDPEKVFLGVDLEMVFLDVFLEKVFLDDDLFTSSDVVDDFIWIKSS